MLRSHFDGAVGPAVGPANTATHPPQTLTTSEADDDHRTVTTPVDTSQKIPIAQQLLDAVTDPEGREILDPATDEVVGRVARTDADRVGLLLRAADAVEAAAESLVSAEAMQPLVEPTSPGLGSARRCRVGISP